MNSLNSTSKTTNDDKTFSQINELKFTNRIQALSNQLSSINEYFSNTLKDLAESTKKTNERVKMRFNKTNLSL